MSLEELRDKLAGMMGGRAAEEIFIGEISTGAANDLRQATEIAKLMIREYGMSEQLGPVSLGDERSSPFLRSAGASDLRTFSERTARLIDEEIRKLSTEALQRAREILLRHRDQMEALAARLLAAEVVEEEDLRSLLGPKVSAPPALLPHAPPAERLLASEEGVQAGGGEGSLPLGWD
jgi:cell division protease FtsH